MSYSMIRLDTAQSNHELFSTYLSLLDRRHDAASTTQLRRYVLMYLPERTRHVHRLNTFVYLHHTVVI